MKRVAVSITVLCLATQMLLCSSAPRFDRHKSGTKVFDFLMQELLHLGGQSGGPDFTQKTTPQQNARLQDLMLHTQSDGIVTNSMQEAIDGTMLLLMHR